MKRKTVTVLEHPAYLPETYTGHIFKIKIQGLPVHEYASYGKSGDRYMVAHVRTGRKVFDVFANTLSDLPAAARAAMAEQVRRLGKAVLLDLLEHSPSLQESIDGSIGSAASTEFIEFMEVSKKADW